VSPQGGYRSRSFPKQSPSGWIAPWLDRMDRHFDDQGFNDSGLKTRLSERTSASRSSRSREAFWSWPPLSGRTRSCGRQIILTPTAFTSCISTNLPGPAKRLPKARISHWARSKASST